MNTRNLHGKTALVTGAASGIGRATALLLAERGADLFLCDVDESGLASAAERARARGRRVWTRRVDVSRRDEMSAFADFVHAETPAVDLLVNNAGVALAAGLLETSLEDWEWILGVNLQGVIHGCHFFVPRMVERGRGHVVNVSSAAGYLPTGALTAYCTTKYAVLGLSEAMRVDLASRGIGVTAICPGLINTPIVHASKNRGALASDAARSRIAQLYQRRNYTPERAAKAILAAVRHNVAVAPVSPEAWALYYAKRYAPSALLRLSALVGDRAKRELG